MRALSVQLRIFFRVAYTDDAVKMRRSHVAEILIYYFAITKYVETLLGKFYLSGCYYAVLCLHVQAGVESLAAYAAHTTDLCSIAYGNHCP